MIGIIGDLHFRPELAYTDYINDHREFEYDNVLKFITQHTKDCDTIVLLGDVFNVKNPTSQTIKRCTEFLENLCNGKNKIFIIAGNHEKMASKSTALDYLMEIKNKPWSVITDKVEICGTNNELVFCPYFYKSELEVINNGDGCNKLMSMIPKSGRMLFVHHAISNTSTASGVATQLFDEIVLPKEELEKRFQLIFGGHIHAPQQDGKTVVAGSVFTNEVGEIEKFIWKVDELSLSVEKIKLPCREIHKLEDPTTQTLKAIPDNSILKVILTKKISASETESLRESLARFDTYLIVEQYPGERKKVHFEEGMLDFNVENMLKIYSKENSIDLDKLMNGYNLVSRQV
jgi:DNA repair exonuclease SbcCD nuclease subunit